MVGFFITILLKLWSNSCLEGCFLTFCLLFPFPVLNLFFILSSYMILQHLELLHYWSQSTQLLCLGSSFWFPKLFSVQEVVQVKAVFSTTIFFASSPKVIGPCCLLSSVCFILSLLHTLSILGRSFFGSAFCLNPLLSLTFDILPTAACVTLQKRKIFHWNYITIV